MIFYFSGTGNTLWVARQISEAIGEPLVSIAAELQAGHTTFELAAGERIGFCFPTHGWQPPAIVRTFIRRLRLAEADDSFGTGGPIADHYCWALTTCGDNTGKTMDILNRELAGSPTTVGGRLVQVVSQFSVQMPESYVCLPFMYTDTDERVSEKIAAAREQIGRIIPVVRERRQGVSQLVKGPLPWVLSHVIGGFFNRFMVTDRKFTVDADRCIRCGQCAKVCPVGNVEGMLPVWRHDGRCTSCLACYHHCPRHAINFGRITRSRGQYFMGKK